MKTFALLLPVLILIASCKKDVSNPLASDDGYIAKYTSTELTKKLETEYKRGQLSALFKEWNLSVQPNSDHFITKNDTIKALYDIYNVVYQPHNLNKLGNWEWDSLNGRDNYVVVQNKIFYSVTDKFDEGSTSWGGVGKDSVENFRPIVDIETSKVLYLTKEYKVAINNFLGSDHFPLGTGGIMNPAMPAGESEKRASALRPYITLLHGHWGNYWHIETHPEINNLILNKSLNKAKVFYRVGYMGGEATLDKQGMAWIITESKSTWIE